MQLVLRETLIRLATGGRCFPTDAQGGARGKAVCEHFSALCFGQGRLEPPYIQVRVCGIRAHVAVLDSREEGKQESQLAVPFAPCSPGGL